MEESILDKILDHPWQFAIIVVSGTGGLWVLGRAFQDFTNHLVMVLKTIFKEFTGNSPAKRAGILNVTLLIIVSALIFIVITPSLLSQFGISNGDSSLGYAVILIFFRIDYLSSWQGRIELLSWFLLIPAIAAYLAMNFTGASTYTSLSGVRKEMRWAVPLEITAGVIGLCLWLGSRFVA